MIVLETGSSYFQNFSHYLFFLLAFLALQLRIPVFHVSRMIWKITDGTYFHDSQEFPRDISRRGIFACRSRTGSSLLRYAPFEVPVVVRGYFSFIAEAAAAASLRAAYPASVKQEQLSHSFRGRAHAKPRTRETVLLFIARPATPRAIRSFSLARFHRYVSFPFSDFLYAPENASVLCLRRPLVFPSFPPARPSGA